MTKEEIKMECLRMAVSTCNSDFRQAVRAANDFYEFIMGLEKRPAVKEAA